MGISAVVGHRGVTHSLLAVAAMLLFLAEKGAGSIAAPLAVGYLSHLAADGLTPSGVPLLWPIKYRFSLGICRTGSVMEMIVVGIILLAVGWAVGMDLRGVKWPKWPF